MLQLSEANATVAAQLRENLRLDESLYAMAEERLLRSTTSSGTGRSAHALGFATVHSLESDYSLTRETRAESIK